VHDLRNQIDTTDSYIENYIPLKTVKEVASILKESLDGEVYERMQAF
jgi:hypothetical protein